MTSIELLWGVVGTVFGLIFVVPITVYLCAKMIVLGRSSAEEDLKKRRLSVSNPDWRSPR